MGKTTPTWLTGIASIAGIARDCILFWELAPSTLTDKLYKNYFCYTHDEGRGRGKLDHRNFSDQVVNSLVAARLQTNVGVVVKAYRTGVLSHTHPP